MKYLLYFALTPVILTVFLVAMLVSFPLLVAVLVAEVLGDEQAARWLEDHTPLFLLFERSWVR